MGCITQKHEYFHYNGKIRINISITSEKTIELFPLYSYFGFLGVASVEAYRGFNRRRAFRSKFAKQTNRSNP
jgi:hypothetical protein